MDDSAGADEEPARAPGAAVGACAGGSGRGEGEHAPVGVECSSPRGERGCKPRPSALCSGSCGSRPGRTDSVRASAAGRLSGPTRRKEVCNRVGAAMPANPCTGTRRRKPTTAHPSRLQIGVRYESYPAARPGHRAKLVTPGPVTRTALTSIRHGANCADKGTRRKAGGAGERRRRQGVTGRPVRSRRP